MPIYVVLYKYTDQGVKEIKSAPARMQEAIKAFEDFGGKMIGLYGTMGEYDLVALGEAPSDEAMMGFNLALGSRGNARTTTLKAFATKQYTEIINKLP